MKREKLEGMLVFVFDNKHYLNLFDSSVYCGVSDRTIRNLAVTKHRYNGNTYVLIDDLDKYIELKKITSEGRKK